MSHPLCRIDASGECVTECADDAGHLRAGHDHCDECHSDDAAQQVEKLVTHGVCPFRFCRAVLRADQGGRSPFGPHSSRPLPYVGFLREVPKLVLPASFGTISQRRLFRQPTSAHLRPPTATRSWAARIRLYSAALRRENIPRIHGRTHIANATPTSRETKSSPNGSRICRSFQVSQRSHERRERQRHGIPS